MFELTVSGTVPVKKNRQRIGKHGGIYKISAVTEYEDLFGWEARIARQKEVPGPFAISGEFRINSTKDLDGVLTTVLDCLQKHGYIENDKLLREIRSLTKVPLKRGEQESITIKVMSV